MIKIYVNDDEKINNIRITGHSLYDDYGKDIVCASVSSIIICSVNGILTINDEVISCSYANDEMIIKVISHDKTTDLLLINMINLLQELSIKYPKNVMICKEMK